PLATSLSAAITSGATNGVVQVGSPFTITVTALNGQGQQATQFTNIPGTITLLSAPAGGTVLGPSQQPITSVPYTVTFVNGVANFTGLSATLAGTYLVRISANGLFVDLTFTAQGRQT